MAGPSNIRVNPFTGTGGATNYVELTEKHIIPAVSPYVIRLNEVPEKQDPSNMKMVYVDSATGAVTENALTEVAATPGQGEFRPDYSTNALDDKTWNTGLIEFSASDAGKIVQVTYTGTGTLAGVTSNHWPSWYTDRGDGSDGDFVPTENTTISGVKNYKSVFIKSGIKITVDKNVYIRCLGSFINKGTIDAVGKGAAGGVATRGKVSGENGKDGTGGGNGGAGGSIPSFMINEAVGGYGGDRIAGWVAGYGAGGGGGTGTYSDRLGENGGNGGGIIVIIAKEIHNTGDILADGQDGPAGATQKSGYSGGGGGGGGTNIAIADTINNTGNISANGGKGGVGDGVEARKGADGENGYFLIKELGT